MEYRPSYIYCRYAINRLRRFQDLARHDQRWAYDIKFAKPLEELLPKGAPNDQYRREVLRQQINRLILTVSAILVNAGIETVVYREAQELEWDFEKKCHVKNKKREEWDLLDNYFDYRSSRCYELLMQAIERGIGFYHNQIGRALLDIVSPLAWIAWFIRLPLVILGMAGVEDRGIIVDLYKKVIYLIMFFILALSMTKLGLSIQWSELIKLIRG